MADTAGFGRRMLADRFPSICKEHLDGGTLACMVFETGKLVGNTFQLVSGRKGMAAFGVEALGRAAHAGADHTWGASAVRQLADAIEQIESLTDYSRELTFNVGLIAGGTVLNRVPHIASAQVEMRAYDKPDFDSGIEQMLALNGLSTVRSAADGYPCTVRITKTGECPPWTQGSDGTIRLLEC